MIVRWLILLSWLGFCFYKGGISMVFAGFLLFGLLAWAWYMIFDTWTRLRSTVQAAVSRPNVTNQTLNLTMTPDELRDVQARRGTPTTDDFAGMITYRRETK